MTFEAIFFLVAESCLVVFAAVLASLYLTPVMRSWAKRSGFLDRPDGGRKAHARDVSLGGGLVVLASALIAIGVTFAATLTHDVPLFQALPTDLSQKIVRLHRLGFTDPSIVKTLDRPDRPVELQGVKDVLLDYQIVHVEQNSQASGVLLSALEIAEVASPNRDVDQERVHGVLDRQQQDPTYLTGQATLFYVGLLGASILICIVGVVDDFVGLRGHYKLAGQIVAALILIGSGLVIRKIALFDQSFEMGILAVPFTLFWLLGAINAINLLDGIDGLAASIGIVLCLTLAAMAFIHGAFFETEMFIALALAGSLAGFLRFNFSPASIYLGDSGSMLIGLVVGAIAIKCSFKEAATVGLAVPFALWAIPILDSAAAIVRRKLTGRSLFATDRGHLHHTLLLRGWSVRKSVIFISLICVATCGSALLSFQLRNELIAWSAILGVVGFLMVMGIFGRVELALVRDRVRSKTRGFSKRNGTPIHESRIQLQGSRQWDHLWTALIESAEEYNLTRIELVLNLPALNEGFYANWSCPGTVEEEISWRLESPLVVAGREVGSLLVMGATPHGSSLGHVGRIADFLEPVEESICKVVAELSQPAAANEPADQVVPPAATDNVVQHDSPGAAAE